MNGIRALRVIAALLLLAASAPVASAPVSIVDADGKTVTLKAPARRIVSLSPAATELLFAAAGGKTLVGRTRFDELAPQSLPEVGDTAAPELHAILALKPDVVLAWPGGNPARVLAQLRRRGVPVVAAHARSLAGIGQLLHQLGLLTGRGKSGQAAQADFDANLRVLSTQYAARQPLRVFVQVATTPLTSVNGDAFVNELLAICRADNVFADHRQRSPVVTQAMVRAAKPQALLIATAYPLDDPASSAELDAAVAPWREGLVLPAVQQRAVIALPSAQIMWPTPDALRAAQQLCAALDPLRGSVVQ